MLYLKTERDGLLSAEMKESYLNGYIDYKKRNPEKDIFLANINLYKEDLESQGIASKDQLAELNNLDILAEASFHADWLSKFAQHFIN